MTWWAMWVKLFCTSAFLCALSYGLNELVEKLPPTTDPTEEKARRVADSVSIGLGGFTLVVMFVSLLGAIWAF